MYIVTIKQASRLPFYSIQQYVYIVTIKQASRLPHVSAKPLHINYDIRQLQNYMHQYWCLQTATMLKISHLLNDGEQQVHIH
jgi:hypothetical protein